VKSGFSSPHERRRRTVSIKWIVSVLPFVCPSGLHSGHV
jgi:hypothetical protein